MAGDGEIAPGTILAGKYRVDRVLGVGGMGVVVAAHHMHLDERVAIKTLLPQMLAHQEAVERFAREARAAVKIKSEHVARVSDVGTLDSGAPYMVMEFLEGEDLGEWVAKRGALPAQQAVEFVLQACDALAEAHCLGIVHRDLKPANLFCIRRADGLLAVKVLDFGISKMGAVGGGEMGMTKTSAVMGSPYYMAPEQMASAKSADPQSDIWSLGAVLFELLVGRVPFEADTLPELVLKIANSPAPDIGEFRPDLPEGLRAVVRRCLERDKSKRFGNVAELAVALCEFGPPERARAAAERIARIFQASGMSPSALSLPPFQEQPFSEKLAATSAGVTGTDKTLAGLGQTTSQQRRPSRAGLFAALAGVLVVGMAVAFLLWEGQPEELTAEEPSMSAAAPGAEVPGPGAEPRPEVPPSAAADQALPSAAADAAPADSDSTKEEPSTVAEQEPAPAPPPRVVNPPQTSPPRKATTSTTTPSTKTPSTKTPSTTTTAKSPTPPATETKSPSSTSTFGGRL